MWNLASGELKNTLEGRMSWVNSVAVSPDSKTIISGSGNPWGYNKMWWVASC